MDREKLAASLMATFLAELDEHVIVLNENVLALEKSPGPAGRAGRIQALFRAAHSLKGAARAVGVTPLEAACHGLEELLAEARDGRMVLDQPVIELLFDAADAIQDAGVRLRAHRDFAGSSLNGLPARFRGRAGSLRVPDSSVPEMPGTTTAGPGESVPVEGASDWVKVASDRLDSLLKRSEDLLIASRSHEVRRTQVDELQRLVGRLSSEVQAASRRDPARRLEGERLRRISREVDGLSAAFISDQRSLEVAVRRMDEEARAIRMVPFEQVFQGLERAVRDLARDAGKEADVVLVGGDVELDRAVLEGLRDPLLALTRNAFDHGIETASDRRAAGKPERGRITITAELRGASVRVTVTDDGRGLDLDAIRAAAVRLGWPVPDDQRELSRLIFLPGVSTARKLTEVSGRGVGLDIARSRLRDLRGTHEVDSTPGVGASFTLAVPLTLTTIRVLMLVAGGQVLAIPLSGVQRLLRINPAEVRPLGDATAVMVDDSPVVAVRLAGLLELPEDDRSRPAGRIPLVVLSAGDRRLAVVVDELLAERSIVVKHPGPRLQQLKGLLGVTVLPDGGTALILSPAELVQAGLSSRAAPVLATESAATRRKRLLIADDSVTTRSLEKSILEAAGFEVEAAYDGEDAWQSLKLRRPDLVVSDADMPRMDGYQLTRAIRGSKRLAGLPVILLTGMEREADRSRGLEAGADAYLLKSGFDQKMLIETIRQLL